VLKTERKYSIVIPMYNASITIIRALDSISNQSKLTLVGEVVVVDDGSTDDSHELVENYKSTSGFPINLIRQDNSGVATARNRGVYESKYNWIAFLDADDEWLSDKLEFQDDLIERNSNIDLLGGEINDSPINLVYKKLNGLTKVETRDILIKVFPQTSTLLFKKEIFEKMGGFTEGLRYGEDSRFLVEFCDNYEYYYHPKKVTIYDGGKQGFGVSGLSSNMEMMHKAHMSNIDYFYSKKIISLLTWFTLKGFYQFKYIRRLILKWWYRNV